MTPTHGKFVELLMGVTTPIFTAGHEARKRGETPKHYPNFGAVFYGHAEIHSALDALELTRQLMLRAPPRSVAIKRHEYLRYLIGNYLQEVYILRERLITYAKKLSRIYKPGSPWAEHLDALPKLVENSFAAMTQHRGLHVHSERYEDEELNYLSMLYTIVYSADHLAPAEHAIYKREAGKLYKTLSAKWAGLVGDTIENMELLLETYFQVLISVTTASGSFQVPEAAAGAAAQPRYVRGAAKPQK